MGMIDKICWKNWDFNFKKEFDDASLFFKNMRYGYGSTVFSLPDECTMTSTVLVKDS
jgi:hypothetical protein